MSEELNELLNKAISRELQVSIQYMWQHVLAGRLGDFDLKKKLRDISIVEMKHAEIIAERLSQLGGTPTTECDQVTVGQSVEEIARNDIEAEEGALELYPKIIELAKEEGDIVTAKIFEKILSEEEEHHRFFESLLKRGDNRD